MEKKKARKKQSPKEESAKKKMGKHRHEKKGFKKKNNGKKESLTDCYIYCQHFSVWQSKELQRERQDIQMWSHYVQMISL